MATDILGGLAAIASIVVIDLVLSGDNAVVIGLAVRRLPPRQRRLAVILGGAGAIALRVFFAAIAALLLSVPFLQAAGGLLLLWIAWKLLREDEAGHAVSEGQSLLAALQTILVADVVMSLDNVLAVAGVSHGNVVQLVFGLVLSMPMIMLSSGLIAAIIDRFPWLTVLGAGILAWTAGVMIRDDAIIGRFGPVDALWDPLIPLVCCAVVVAFWRWRQRHPVRRPAEALAPCRSEE